MWSTVPPDVAFVIAHAASFRVLYSALDKMSINKGNMLASITACRKQTLLEKKTLNSIKFLATKIPIRANHSRQISFYFVIRWKLRSTCIWSLFPAVIFEMVQQVSLRIDSFGLVNRLCKHGNTEQLMIACVWVSSPVTILPTARSAADTTVCWWCLRQIKPSVTTTKLAVIQTRVGNPSDKASAFGL